MNESIICITKDILYAVRLGKTKDYWRVAWSKDTWTTTIEDVTNTLGTKEFHVLLSGSLPSLTNDLVLDEAQTIRAYKEELATSGCTPLSVKAIEAISGEELATKIESYIPQPLQIGSLEDLNTSTVNNSHTLKYILIALVAMLIAGGIWLIFGQGIFLSKAPSASISPSPTPLTIATPTPSPIAPSPNNQDFTVQVQNGSTIAGLAGKLSAKLESLGFVVKDVGNADKTNYLHAEIQSKSTVPEAIISLLTETVIDSAIETATLSASSKYDVVIILGSKSSLSN